MTAGKFSPIALSLGISVLVAASPLFVVADPGTSGSVSGRIVSRSVRMRQNVVVYVEHVDGTFPPPEEPAVLDQHGMRFLPRVLPILLGTQVVFRNHDSVRHNVFSPDQETYDLGVWARGQQRVRRFRRLGVYQQLCHLHPGMHATILVLQNPYFAVTGADGQYHVNGVPEGDHVLKIWSYAAEEIRREIHVRAGRTTLVNVRTQRPRK